MSSAKWDLPEDEGNRLIYYFLSECCINTMQALADVVGIKEAEQLWRPYNTLAARAYVLNRLQDNRFPRLLDNEDKLLITGIFYQHFYRALLGGKCEDMMIYDRSLSIRISDLQPPNMLETQAMHFRSEMGPEQVIDPQFHSSVHRMSKNSAVLLVKRKDDVITGIGNEGTPRLCILQLKIDADEIDFWKRHYWGEFWRQGSAMLVEEFGEERASQIIEPYMRQIGHFYGDFFKNRFQFHEYDPKEVAQVILLLNRLLKEEGKLVEHEDNDFSCQITSCPFSNSSPFVCKQMSMIFNSICQTINKEIRFVYDNGLMKGESSCKWSVKK